MSLTLSDIDDLRRKKHDPIVVGELPNIIRLALRLRVPLVHFSHQSLKHVEQRHPDVRDLDLLLIPFVIRHGLILRQRRKRNVIIACYQQPMSHRRFLAAMKISDRGSEVWLDSFYRTRPRETARLLRGAEVLKHHD
jgi:hypothetical protein